MLCYRLAYSIYWYVVTLRDGKLKKKNNHAITRMKCSRDNFPYMWIYCGHSGKTVTKSVQYSTQPSFVTLLSRRAQSGRLSSFGKRVWFTESHIVLIISFLLVLFTQFTVDKTKKKACCIKLNNQIIFYQNNTVTSLYSHLHHTRTRLTSLLDFRYQLLTFSAFKSLHSYVSPP